MCDPLDSIPDYCISRLRNIQQIVQNFALAHKCTIVFSDGFMLPETVSEEHKKRMQAIANDFELLQEFIESNHPWALDELSRNYWKYLRANEPHNAGYCAMQLRIDEEQMNIDLVKAQVYIFLEEIGLPCEEALAEEMAVKVIEAKDAEGVFTSYVKSGVIEFEENGNNSDQTQTDDEWECEYCGAIFSSPEEALRHEEVCEMNCDEDDLFQNY